MTIADSARPAPAKPLINASDPRRGALSNSAQRLLAELAKPRERRRDTGVAALRAADSADLATLIAADLVEGGPGEKPTVSAAGRAYLARAALAGRDAPVDPFRGQHLALGHRQLETPTGPATVAVDAEESPLAWLARRKGRNGRPLITSMQLLAGERLRADFTRAQMTPRMAANLTAAVAQRRRAANDSAAFSDRVIVARQRVRRALDTVGPEFAGLLLDVCCFLKGLEDVERERRWPPRSAKVVVQLGLDRLARHYGLAEQAQGRARGEITTWLAEDAALTVGE